jgi:hypothetical protein
MDIQTAEQYLGRLSRIAVETLTGKSPLKRDIRTEIRSVLTSPLIYNTATKTWRVILRDPREKRGERDELTEAELARVEFEALHEAGHITHMILNPELRRKQKSEQTRGKLPGGSWEHTQEYARLHTLSETIAEYGALHYIAQRQGSTQWRARYGWKRDLTDVYGMTYEAYNLCEKKGKAEDVWQMLFQAPDLHTIETIPELKKIVENTEEYLRKNPHKFLAIGTQLEMQI